MSDEEKERRCKACGKLLLDEKMPFCRRCVLEGRNKIGQISGTLVGGLMFIGSAKAIVSNNLDNSKQNCEKD